MIFGFLHGKPPVDDRQLELDPALEQTLRDLRQSVHGWSEEAMVRPRMHATVRRRIWRLAAGWALGVVLVAGAVSAGYMERQHMIHKAQIAAQEAERMRLAAEQSAREEEDLLAMVDKDVSRQAPSAMEPLVMLMDEGEEDAQ